MRLPALSLSLALAAPAGARPGPDVIVGDITDTTHYTTSGPIGGMRAWSIGTTSCNLGDQQLDWISGTNQHPVISQNLYRLVNTPGGGRFEQIGQAWLKHGFCALQGSECESCSNPNFGCSALQPHCSDPYSSGLNGQQSGLGPKSEVNAATGAFPYPWINNGTGSGDLFKRLQASDADVTVAGAQYFVSSMYVQPQDAAAGNDDNNESYRRITFSISRAMMLQGMTERTRPGIQAWRDHGLGANIPDPGVNIVNVDVPGDGRFIIAARATDLGGGVYHYEYAVQNLNSHRSGQSLSIPFPPGTTVTNVGFHDVAYHSGEPYALTDWTPSMGASGITWATQTFFQNPNANALRWDTIYNFRFAASAAPGSGLATLVLFRPGTPAFVTATTVVPGGSVAPPNDTCANAANITGYGPTAFDTTNATTDGPAHAACLNAGSNQITSDVWFNHPSQCDGTLTVETCGNASFDTRLAVYDASSCGNVNDSTLLACDDDACSLQSRVAVPVVSGRSYTLRIGGYNGATGSGNVVLTCTPRPACACDVNDDGALNSQDYFDFLIAFFDGSPAADFNGDGPVNSQDFFDFLLCFFDGC
jgi:hypothetical protein